MQEKFSSMNDLELFFNQNQVFDKYGLDQIGVFGSFARGEKNFNDIDLLVDSDDLQKMANLKEFLNQTTGINFDVATKKRCNPIVLYRAEKELKYARKHSK